MDVDSILRKTYDQFKQYQTESVPFPEKAQQDLTRLFTEGTQALNISKEKVHVKEDFVPKLNNFIAIATKHKHERHGGALVAAATAFLYQLQRIKTHEDEEAKHGRKVKDADLDQLG